jgi:hypothetical protein
MSRSSGLSWERKCAAESFIHAYCPTLWHKGGHESAPSLPAELVQAALEHLEHSHGLPCATVISNKHVWKTLLHKFFSKMKPDNRLIVKTTDTDKVRQHMPVMPLPAMLLAACVPLRCRCCRRPAQDAHRVSCSCLQP